MSFTAPSSGVITQTGRDLNFSGLAGNSGVTITTDAGITFYDFGQNRLLVQGTINHDPEKEVLIFRHLSTSSSVSTPVLKVELTTNAWVNITGWQRDANGYWVITTTHSYQVGDALSISQTLTTGLDSVWRVRAVSGNNVTLDASHLFTESPVQNGRHAPKPCYNYGREITANGKTRYSSGAGLIFSGGSVSNWDVDEYSLHVTFNGYFWSRGGEIVTQRQFSLDSRYDIRDTIFLSTRVATAGATLEARSFGGGITQNVKLVNLAALNVQYARRLGLSLAGSSLAEALGAYYEVSLRDFDATSNTASYDIGHDANNSYAHRDWEIVNSANGSNVVAMWRDTRGNVGQKGCLVVKKEVSLNVKDASANALAGVKVYLQDNPSPYSKNATFPVPASAPYTAAPTLLNGTLNGDGTITYSYADPFTYQYTTDASGNVPTFKVTTASHLLEYNADQDSARAFNGGPYAIPSFTGGKWRETNGLEPQYSDWDTNRFGGFYRVDRRSDSNTSADDFTFKFCSYLHSLSQTTQALTGTGTLAINWVLFADASVSETNKGIVDGYLQLDTPEKFYDRAKSFLTDNYAGETATLVSRNGNEIDAGTYNITIDAAAASAFAFDGSTITIKAATFTGNITTSGTITLANGAQVLGTYGSTTVLPWTVTNVEATSTLQLFNITQDAEVENLVTTGTAGTKVTASGTYSNAEVAPGDTIRLRLTCQAGATALEPYEAFGVATSVGISFRADQVADEVYNANGIDGSTITTLTADYPNVQIDISDGDGIADARELYAFAIYQSTTAEGIEKWFGAITPIDLVNYRVNTAVADLRLQNIGAAPLIISGARIYRDDNTTILSASPGDQPMTLDAGNLIQYIQPQVDTAITNNATITKVKANTGLIPALL